MKTSQWNPRDYELRGQCWPFPRDLNGSCEDNAMFDEVCFRGFEALIEALLQSQSNIRDLELRAPVKTLWMGDDDSEAS